MPTKTTEEWIAILQPKDVFCERVNNYTDYLEHPHVKESGAIDWVEVDGFGRMPVANIPGLPPASTHEPQQHAPHIGEDGVDAVLARPTGDRRHDGVVIADPRRALDPAVEQRADDALMHERVANL